ncbi:MAG: P1 family peptidase [Tissierellia bacterium]|nr:P1 family peptidase [Tissierellia bacterium]
MNQINIQEIDGFNIGHYTDNIGATGCTAIICKEGAIAGVDVRGGGPASRETELLKSTNMVDKIHCVMLSGGSAFGLDAGSGAMEYLEERNIGFNVGVGVVPIVCGASLFDLVVGDPKARPDKQMGYKACVNSENNMLEEGNVGAGTGATVGKYLGIDYMMKSGLGTYALQNGNLKVGALVAVNALGDVIDIDTGEIIAGLLTENKAGFRNTFNVMMDHIEVGKNVFSGNTTLGCIITNAKLTKTQANRIATVAHNGFAKAINPVHTSVDGDTIFVLSYGDLAVDVDALGALSAEVMAKAINRAVLMAKSEYGIKGRD